MPGLFQSRADKNRRLAEILATLVAARQGRDPYGGHTPRADARISAMGLDVNTLLPRDDDSDAAVFARALTGSMSNGRPGEDSRTKRMSIAVQQYNATKPDPRGKLDSLEKRLEAAQRMLLAKGYGRAADTRLASSAFPSGAGFEMDGAPMAPGLDATAGGIPRGWYAESPNPSAMSRKDIWANANSRRAAMQAALAPRKALVQQRAAIRAMGRNGIPVNMGGSQQGGQQMDPRMLQAMLTGQGNQLQHQLGMAQLLAQLEEMKGNRAAEDRKFALDKERWPIQLRSELMAPIIASLLEQGRVEEAQAMANSLVSGGGTFDMPAPRKGPDEYGVLNQGVKQRLDGIIEANSHNDHVAAVKAAEYLKSIGYSKEEVRDALRQYSRFEGGRFLEWLQPTFLFGDHPEDRRDKGIDAVYGGLGKNAIMRGVLGATN